MDLTDQDWMLLMSGAKQRKYRKGDCVLEEGQSTSALFQILQGSLRVELKMKNQNSGATTSVTSRPASPRPNGSADSLT